MTWHFEIQFKMKMNSRDENFGFNESKDLTP